MNDLPASRAEWDLDGPGTRTEKQHRFLCAICGDLAKQIQWHGDRMTRDDWRHFLSGNAMGWRTVLGYDHGDGRRGIVMLGGSSKKLSKSQAKEAITMGLHIGDEPQEQGLRHQPVKWSDAVLRGLGFNPEDIAA